jgi:hypothetical protein
MHSKIKLQVRAIIHTKDGRIFIKYPWKNANSLINAFIQILMAQMTQANQTIKDVLNANISVPAYSQNFQAIAELGNTTYGILIGSGTTPVAMADYKLETQIITNVAHAATSIALQNPNASTWRIALSRIFTNNTGGILAIKEVALYIVGAATPNYFCGERTLYSVDVPDTYPITFQYRITITL